MNGEIVQSTAYSILWIRNGSTESFLRWISTRMNTFMDKRGSRFRRKERPKKRSRMKWRSHTEKRRGDCVGFQRIKYAIFFFLLASIPLCTSLGLEFCARIFEKWKRKRERWASYSNTRLYGNGPNDLPKRMSLTTNTGGTCNTHGHISRKNMRCKHGGPVIPNRLQQNKKKTEKTHDNNCIFSITSLRHSYRYNPSTLIRAYGKLFADHPHGEYNDTRSAFWNEEWRDIPMFKAFRSKWAFPYRDVFHITEANRRYDDVLKRKKCLGKEDAKWKGKNGERKKEGEKRRPIYPLRARNRRELKKLDRDRCWGKLVLDHFQETRRYSTKTRAPISKKRNPLHVITFFDKKTNWLKKTFTLNIKVEKKLKEEKKKNRKK